MAVIRNVEASGSAPADTTPSYAVLAHELLGHGYDFDQGLDRGKNVFLPVKDYKGLPASILVSDREMNAVRVENDARSFGGSMPRKYYGGYKLPELKPVLKPRPGRR